MRLRRHLRKVPRTMANDPVARLQALESKFRQWASYFDNNQAAPCTLGNAQKLENEREKLVEALSDYFSERRPDAESCKPLLYATANSHDLYVTNLRGAQNLNTHGSGL